MKQIVLTLTAKAPLAIGQRKPGGSVSEAMDYIPGTVIRGAIAAGILQQAQQAPEPGDQFHALLVDETAAIFQNAYPAIAQVDEGQYQPSSGQIRLLPATALSSKTNPGFQPKAGVFDALIDSFCAGEHGHFYEPNDLKGDRVEPFKGFYSQQGDHYYSHAISKRLLTRVGINRRRATAEENILYSLEVLNETQGKTSPQPSIYRSAILVADDLADPLHQFIRQHERSFRLGGSNSRGLGHVHIQTELQDSLVDAEAIKNRVEQFTDKLRERWSQWSVFNSSKQMPDKTYFTLDLQSDAILTENWRRTMVISAEMLSQFAHIDSPIDDSILKLEMAYSSYDYRSGWNAAWGLCKDVELVTKMGSVFLFSTNNPEQWCEPLARLEPRGVGDRTSEGYGQIKICDNFLPSNVSGGGGMSTLGEKLKEQQIELSIQREIRKSEDNVVKWIEEALQKSKYLKFRGNPNEKKLEESQFRNVLRVADTTDSPEVIKNFLRYQTGRDEKWGRGQNSLAERIIQDIDGNLRKTAQEISDKTNHDKFKEIWLDLIRRYLGYGSRYLLYLNTPNKNT